jgi:hypothetical protein
MYLDDMNRIGISVEGSKLLVPGSEYVGIDPYRRPKYEIPNVGPMAGIGKSFKNKTASCIVVL